MDKRQRKKAARRAAAWQPPKPPCPNCGQPGPHFVPPCFGEEGFYACEAINRGQTVVLGIDHASGPDKAAHCVMLGNRLLGIFDTEEEALAAMTLLDSPTMADALAYAFAKPPGGLKNALRLPHPDAIPVVMTAEQIAALKASGDWIEVARG